MKQFVALARVSSREQEREGFSLEVQEDALRRYALQHGGEIIRFFKIAETASKSDERKAFKELIRYAKQRAPGLDGLLFYKVDRAARNLFDYVELERLESEYRVPFISVSQPTENTPSGRMMRRTMANMASFYTEQQSVDVKEGLNRRVQEGWFVGKAPYGYRNVRRDGRGVVETDPHCADNIRRMFHLYAYEPLTLDGLIERLTAEGRVYRLPAMPFAKGSVHNILRDRAYIGEVEYRGQWYPGKHEPLVDRGTWDRVQAIVRGCVYHSHEMTYAGEFMTCGHCGHPVTGERKVRQTKNGEREYVYYRCARYTAAEHPRIRVPEAELDRQMLELFGRMKVQDPDVAEWFRSVLRSQTKDSQEETAAQNAELHRQRTLLTTQQSRLIDMRMGDEIDQETFARKQTELRDRLASITLQLEVVDRSGYELADLAVKVFELSQTLTEKWLTADYATKRRILEIVCLNCRLEGASLCPTIRKPFDVLAEGLSIPSSRGDRI
jgi:site-specific DNA recombinase